MYQRPIRKFYEILLIRRIQLLFNGLVHQSFSHLRTKKQKKIFGFYDAFHFVNLTVPSEFRFVGSRNFRKAGFYERFRITSNFDLSPNN